MVRNDGGKSLRGGRHSATLSYQGGKWVLCLHKAAHRSPSLIQGQICSLFCFAFPLSVLFFFPSCHKAELIFDLLRRCTFTAGYCTIDSHYIFTAEHRERTERR